MKYPTLKSIRSAIVKNAVPVFIASLLWCNAKAQTPPKPVQVMLPGTDIYTAPQTEPKFQDGAEGFGGYLAKTIKYPKDARDKNVQGRVFLQFVVEKDGSLSNIKVIRGIGSGCDEEALKAIETGPKWTPGQQDGKIVRSMFTVPVQFSLAKG